MAHVEQMEFVQSVLEKFPEFKSKRVLEVGSLDVNGTIRKFFNTDDYTGIDIHEGKYVDEVCLGHEYKSKKKFDVVCSAECFEHDEHYEKTLKNMYSLLRKGGLFFFTCASTGRPEHGTQSSVGGLWGTSPEYYKNLTEDDIREVFDVDKSFSEYYFEYNPKSQDLYFWGIKQ